MNKENVVKMLESFKYYRVEDDTLGGIRYIVSDTALSPMRLLNMFMGYREEYGKEGVEERFAPGFNSDPVPFGAINVDKDKIMILNWGDTLYMAKSTSDSIYGFMCKAIDNKRGRAEN